MSACLGAVACGSSHTRAAHRATHAVEPICVPRAEQAIARFLRIPTSAITTAASTGNNAMPQCAFTVRGDGVLTANVDTSPSPYFRLERAAVETSQMVTPSRILPAPQPVDRLGLEAYWFPVQSQLMCTDGVRLVTVTPALRHLSPARERALAEAVSRVYLRKPPPNADSLLTKGEAAPP